MPSAELCPFCHNSSVTTGHYYDPETVGDVASVPLFKPDGIEVPLLTRWFGHSFSAPVEHKAKACLHCGSLWTVLDLEKLKAVFRKYGTQRSKNRFSFDLGP